MNSIALSKTAWKGLAALLCLGLMLPTQAHAGILDIFSSIESTINNTIGKALTEIKTVQTQAQALYKQALWPVAAITQAQSFVRSTINTYRGWMTTVYRLPISSAQLSNPKQLESMFLSGSGNSVNVLQMHAGYTATYGALPGANSAPSTVLQIVDMNDALAKDALAQTMASDQANTQMLALADQMENGAASAAPGTSPYVSASALTATLQTQAFQLKLLASQLREESGQLAHQNARLKQSVTGRNQLNQNLQQMLSTSR